MQIQHNSFTTKQNKSKLDVSLFSQLMKGDRNGYKQVIEVHIELVAHIPELFGLVETE